jgi:hypothetical protein
LRLSLCFTQRQFRRAEVTVLGWDTQFAVKGTNGYLGKTIEREMKKDYSSVFRFHPLSP